MAQSAGERKSQNIQTVAGRAEFFPCRKKITTEHTETTEKNTSALLGDTRS
jgi:hypothetical protein